MKKKRIAVLGATGSIGQSSLDVISRNKENFEIVLLSAHSDKTRLELLKNQYPGAFCVLSGEKDGKNKLLEAIGNVQPDITINGISGAAGLEPSLAAIEAGSNLALANKETVVMAGQLAFRLAKEKNVKIIPVDSEHSAIFHLIEAHGGKNSEAVGPAERNRVAFRLLAERAGALAEMTWKRDRPRDLARLQTGMPHTDALLHRLTR